MSFELRVAPVAEEHIRAATLWWAEHRKGSPDLLRNELQRAFELITSQPGIGAPVVEKGYEAVRRITLRRSRYHLYYQIHEQAVEVLALWHVSRGQGPPLVSPA